jgi:hypothetical protein
MTARLSLDRMAIFAGPSRSPHLTFAAARCFPPARAGDLSDAADNGFTHIVLADTLFLDAPPNHREIIAVIERGTTVFGCSSAGALRAIELMNHGMIGSGVVFGLYKARRLLDDAELACVLDQDHRAVTPSLLQIRYYLGYALGLGFSPRAVTRAFEEMTSVYYMKRDYKAVDDIIARHLGGGDLQFSKGIADADFAIKSIDLENCLAEIAQSAAIDFAPFRHLDINAAWLDAGLLLGA